MLESFRYIIDNNGVDREDGYNYTGRVSVSCCI